jgi:hypothetical protein
VFALRGRVIAGASSVLALGVGMANVAEIVYTLGLCCSLVDIASEEVVVLFVVFLVGVRLVLPSKDARGEVAASIRTADVI